MNNDADFESDGCVHVFNPETEKIKIVLDAEAVKFFAEDGGMFFPGHNIIVKSAEIVM